MLLVSTDGQSVDTCGTDLGNYYLRRSGTVPCAELDHFLGNPITAGHGSLDIGTHTKIGAAQKQVPSPVGNSH